METTLFAYNYRMQPMFAGSIWRSIHERQTRCRDPVLSKVYCFVRDGWPSETSNELKPFRNQEMELSIENGCLMWGIRVLVPKSLQAQVLQSLDANHLDESDSKKPFLVDRSTGQEMSVLSSQ